MADDGFQLPKSTYDEVRNIIVAYGHLDKPGTLQDVSDRGGGSTTTVSRNNGFLLSVGIIEGSRKKGPSELGQQLANALQHEQDLPYEVARLWHKVVSENDFLQKVLAAVRVRNGMEHSALVSHIVYTAGENKSSRVMTGAKTIIDILSVAGLVEESDGKIVAVSDPNERSASQRKADASIPNGDSTSAGVSKRLEEKPNLVSKPVQIATSRSGVGIEIKIDVSISCTVDELEELAEGLQSLVDHLSDEGVGSDNDNQPEQ